MKSKWIEVLEQRRKTDGLTKVQFSQRLGISAKQYSQLVHSDVEPQPGTIAQAWW